MGTTETSRQVGEMAVRGEDFRVRAGYRRSRIARHLWKTTALTTLALGLSSIAAYGDPNGLWQPQIRAIIGADNNGGNAALEGFIPLKQTAESVLFLDVRAKHDFKDSFGQDVGLGIRRIVNPDLMVGGYAYLNVENYNSNQFTSATLGAEAITSHFDAHVNVYLPIKGDHTDHSTSSTLSMVSNQLMEQISVLDHRDYAAWGIEGEIGAQVPVNLPDKHSLRLDIGGYHFEDPHGDDGSVTGAKAGFEYTVGDVFGSGTELVFAGEVRNDNRDDTQFAGSVRLNIPFNPGHGSDNADGADSGPEPVYPVSEGLRKRVNERVRGDIGVRIQSQTLNGGTTTRVAINAATNAAFGKFYYADGGNSLGLGTIGDPTTLDDAVAKAGSGFVVALGGAGNITTAGVTLASGQTVIGGGGSVTAKLFGGGTGTFNLGGSDGTIQGTNVANPVITLGNGNTLNGITITGGGDGIFGNNVTGTKLTKVTVDGAGGNGAEFTGNSTNVTASDFTAKNNGLDGLHIEGDGTYNFTGTTLLQHNADDGLDVTGKGTYTFATLNAKDNADRGITVQGTSAGGSFTTTGGTVSGNGGTAVFIDPITAHVVLDSISQSGGTSGVVLDQVSGSFTVNGATTISNTTGPAIAISNSPAAIRFGDVNITNPGADAISFAGVNAAVVAGNIVISGLGVGTGLDFSGAKTNFTAQSLNITGTGAAGSIGIDLTSPSAGGATIVITNGGAIANVDTGVRFGIAGSLANSANAEFTFGGGSIAGITASLDARGLNQTLGHYAFGSTTFSGAQLFDVQNVIFVGASATGTGTGSSLLDLASIATADANTDANAIFVLVNRGTAIDDTDGFSLGAGQTLASFGNGRTFSLGGIPVNVTGDNVTHTAAVSDAGGAATLTDSGTGNVVTLANNTSALDFSVSGGAGYGIYGNGVSNVTLSGVNVSGAAMSGVAFDGTNTVTATNLNSSGNTDAGLSIQGDGSYNFGGTTTLSNNGDNGLFIVGDGTYAFQTLNASGNSGFGVNVLSTTGTFSTTDGTISGNGAAGVVLLGANIDVTLTSLTQDGGGFGAMFAGVSGNFAVSGATTVSNTILGGLGIFDSTADFTFEAVDISDITAPGGIGIDVQNSGGAVTFGGPVTLTHIDSEGILAIDNAGTLAFSGPVSMTDPGDGIWLEDNTGAVSFGGAVTIDQLFGSGIDVVGSNGVISFGDIDITGLCNCSTALDLSGSTSTFTASTLDVSGSSGGSSIGIDLSGTNGGSVTIGSGVITGVDTGVQMGTNGLAGTTANTAFSFGAAGGASISGVTASLDMRGLSPGSGSYAFNDTVLNGPQLFDIANVIYVGSANTGLGDGSSVNDLINAAAADDLTTDANTIFVLVKTASVQTTDTDADGFTLADSQSIVSFANGGTVTRGGPPANVTGTNVTAGATQADPFGFGGATLNNAAASTIELANGNLVKNLSVSNGTDTAIDGTGNAGLTINGVTISSAAFGLILNGSTGIVTVDDLDIQSASQTGIALVGSSATVNFTGNTTITGAAG
ncbi:MAG: right-handed parallel beta-helix repeat-containing protein, partial [Mesorhizobium sp.]